MTYQNNDQQPQRPAPGTTYSQPYSPYEQYPQPAPQPRGTVLKGAVAGGVAGAAVSAALVAVLWPLASLYAFEYMETEGDSNAFFAWYTMTYGVTVGIAFAANLMTMYMFYEMLTLVTIPLMMHGRSY